MTSWLRGRWRHDEADLMPQLRAWASSEPVIQPLALPPVKPLKARKATRVNDRLERFRVRIGGR